MSKGASTRDAVIREALGQAYEVGLEALSLGGLAERLKLSKSGLFAHFKSKEALQLAVLEEAVDQFREQVIAPALTRPRGEPRVVALYTGYLDWMERNPAGTGCIFTALAQEYDDRPGPVRDRLVETLSDWNGVLTRAANQAVQERHFRLRTDPSQMAFEITGIGMAFHQSFKLFKDPNARQRADRAFERLLDETRRLSRHLDV